jgi:hypothetical protein
LTKTKQQTIVTTHRTPVKQLVLQLVLELTWNVEVSSIKCLRPFKLELSLVLNKCKTVFFKSFFVVLTHFVLCWDVLLYLTEAEINRALFRLFRQRFELGMFDPPNIQPYLHIPPDVVDSTEHSQLALQLAREGIVLLKRTGSILPIPKNATVAVIGMNFHQLLCQKKEKEHSKMNSNTFV